MRSARRSPSTTVKMTTSTATRGEEGAWDARGKRREAGAERFTDRRDTALALFQSRARARPPPVRLARAARRRASEGPRAGALDADGFGRVHRAIPLRRRLIDHRPVPRRWNFPTLCCGGFQPGLFRPLDLCQRLLRRPTEGRARVEIG